MLLTRQTVHAEGFNALNEVLQSPEGMVLGSWRNGAGAEELTMHFGQQHLYLLTRRTEHAESWGVSSMVLQSPEGLVLGSWTDGGRSSRADHPFLSTAPIV